MQWKKSSLDLCYPPLIFFVTTHIRAQIRAQVLIFVYFSEDLIYFVSLALLFNISILLVFYEIIFSSVACVDIPRVSTAIPASVLSNTLRSSEKPQTWLFYCDLMIFRYCFSFSTSPTVFPTLWWIITDIPCFSPVLTANILEKTLIV